MSTADEGPGEPPIDITLTPPWGFHPIWCLLHNVAVAGAIKLATENGWWDGAGYHRRNP